MKRARAWVLALTSLLVGPSARADVVHTYTRGETLAALSERYYGTAAQEAVLVAANGLHLQASPSLMTGVHLVIPSVSYHRVAPGETWERLGQRLLGHPRHGPYLARSNRGSFDISPSVGTVVRVPYLLRFVVGTDEPLFEIARRFYGDRAMVQFILGYNQLSSTRLQRGQVLVLPLADLTLREVAPGSPEAPLVAAHGVQREAERDLPALLQHLRRGQYVEAVELGARLRARPELSVDQRVALLRALAEAYVALERQDLAVEALREALTVQPSATFDPALTPPKVLEALALARGGSATEVIAPPPSTARPERAH
ncbi:MAG: LysM peptidoglycan-binding domain-containing protein [Deltaproteobacteria bacterium]|nr:LysM peptidoglycan-binding domain-containing protein [Deltaproteobacteria bacterium]